MEMVTGAVGLGKGHRRGTVTQGMGLTGTKAKALNPHCLVPVRCLQWASLWRQGSSRPPSPTPPETPTGVRSHLLMVPLQRMLRAPALPWHTTWPACPGRGVTVPARKTPEHSRNWVEKHIGYSVTSLLSCPAPNETVTALDSLFILHGQLRAVQEENCQLPAPPLLSHAFCKCKQDHAITVNTETPPAKRSSSSPEHPELPAGRRLSRTLLHRAAPGSLMEPISSRHCRAARPMPGLGAQAARLLPLPCFP